MPLPCAGFRSAAGRQSCRPGRRDIHRVGLSSLATTGAPSTSSLSAVPPAALFSSTVGVSDALIHGSRYRGITTPFPIQAATLPDSSAGRDVCGKAPPGAGKTLAFGLAVFSRLESTSRAVPSRGRRAPSALILVPTRELAAQIQTNWCAPRRGDRRTRRVRLRRGRLRQAVVRSGEGVDVLSPVRKAVGSRGTRARRLSYVDIVVVDEADRMADMGFLPAVRGWSIRPSPAGRPCCSRPRWTVPSTSWCGTTSTARYAMTSNRPTRTEERSITISGGSSRRTGSRSQPRRSRLVAGDGVLPDQARRRPLSQRLARSGLSLAAIHGDRSQSQREHALAAFRAGRLDVLVATDVAARGIHVDGCPSSSTSTHPPMPPTTCTGAGGTGRAGADGNVVSLMTRAAEQTAANCSDGLEPVPGAITSPDVPSLALVSPAPPRRPRCLSGALHRVAS